MQSRTKAAFVAGLIGFGLSGIAHSQTEPEVAWSPLDVANAAAAKECVKTLMAAPATTQNPEKKEKLVSAGVGNEFGSCMEGAKADNYHEFNVGRIYFLPTCFKLLRGRGGICVMRSDSGFGDQGRIMIAGPGGRKVLGRQALVLTIDMTDHEKLVRKSYVEPSGGSSEPVGCKNSYGDPCGTTY